MDMYHTNWAVPSRDWYTPNPSRVIVPVELLLAVNLQMDAAVMPPKAGPNGPVLRKYMEQGAVVLKAADREIIMAELCICKRSSDSE